MPDVLDSLLRDRITDVTPMRLSDIEDNPRNPKSHPAKQGRAIRGLVSQIGWAGVPLVYQSVRTGKLTFVDGHLRKREFPDATVRVALTDLTDAEADALLVTYDPIAQLAETNKDEFARLLAEVRPDNPDMQDLLETIARKLKVPFGESEPLPDEVTIERADELQEKWQVHPGELWKLDSGNDIPHYVLCADSTNPINIRLLMGRRIARMCMTDPPYNIDYGQSTSAATQRRAIAKTTFSMDSWLKFVHAFGTRIKENCTGDVYIWGASGLMGERMRIYLAERLGLHWSGTIIWVKDRFTLGRSKYQHQHEIAWHGFVEESSEILMNPDELTPDPRDGSIDPDDPDQPLPDYAAGDPRPIAQYGWFKRSSFNDETRNQTDIWVYNRPETSAEHPTMKPPELLEIGIRNSSRPGDIIIDYFLGSGSTLLACERLGRRCFGAELEPAYVSVTLERFANLSTSQPEIIASSTHNHPGVTLPTHEIPLKEAETTADTPGVTLPADNQNDSQNISQDASQDALISTTPIKEGENTTGGLSSTAQPTQPT